MAEGPLEDRNRAAERIKGPPASGTLLALIGGLFGLAAGLALSSLRAFGGPPPRRLEEAPGNAVFAFIIVSPYIIALFSTRLKPGARAQLLLAASLLSLASMGISLAGAGIVFLPATVLLFIAAARSFRAAGWRGRRTVLPVILSIAAAAVVGLSFASLFMHDDPRCWQWIGYDGRKEWKSIPTPPGIFQGQGMPPQQEVPPPPPGATSAGSECTSDIITGVEAARSMGVLAAGVALVAGAGWSAREKCETRKS